LVAASRSLDGATGYFAVGTNTVVFNLVKRSSGSVADDDLLCPRRDRARDLETGSREFSVVWKQVYDESIEPYTVAGSQMGAKDAWEKGVAPIRNFMSQQIAMAGNYDDVHLFYQRYAPGQSSPDHFESVPLVVLLPAYMLSELKTAFLMGFQIYLPFLVLDLVIAAVTTALGLSQLSPATIAIPFKLLLFVLVDGWRLVVQMLLDSFGSFVPI
jgi:flagellar biosynthetic protein FliP